MTSAKYSVSAAACHDTGRRPRRRFSSIDRSGFIQRLAVDPARQRTGVGLRLMHAAHRWLRSHRCTTALVNTETDNLAALRLYQRFGYAELPYGLQVLERPLTHAAEVS